MIVKVVSERSGLTAAQTRDVYYGYDLGNRQLYPRFDGATGPGHPYNAAFGFAETFASRQFVASGLARTLMIAFLAVLAACGPVEQPEGLRFVAAVEISLQTAADRNDLVAMLRRHAAANGLHVDDVSREAERTASALPPSARKTIYVGAWRGLQDDDLEVSIDDTGHPGRAWIAFSRGAQPILATRMRESLLAEITRRWPDARRIPIPPSGGLPSPDDLRLTPQGYILQ
jgi:hypothetical protein